MPNFFWRPILVNNKYAFLWATNYRNIIFHNYIVLIYLLCVVFIYLYFFILFHFKIVYGFSIIALEYCLIMYIS